MGNIICCVYPYQLLQFCADPEPGEGLLKALALVTGQGVSWPDYIESPDPSVKDVSRSHVYAKRTEVLTYVF